MDLVEQLFLHRAVVDHPAGPVQLGDDRLAVGPDLGDREAQPREPGHRLGQGIGEVTAGDLARTFQQVADGGARAQRRPVVMAPPVARDHWRQEQRWIGDAPGYHYGGACLQRRQQGIGPEVRVGPDQGASDLGDRASELGNLGRAVDPIADLVALDAGDGQPAQAKVAGDLGGLLGGPPGIRDAHVGDDAGAVLGARRQYRPQPALEVAVVAGLRIGAPLEVAKGHRAFADALEDQNVERAALGELQGRVQPVRRKPGPGANPQHRFSLAREAWTRR